MLLRSSVIIIIIIVILDHPRCLLVEVEHAFYILAFYTTCGIAGITVRSVSSKRVQEMTKEVTISHQIS